MKRCWRLRRFSSTPPSPASASSLQTPLALPFAALLRCSLLPHRHPPLPLLSLFLKSGLSSDLRLATLLIHRLSHSGLLDEARVLLSNPNTDTVAWNASIFGCGSSGRVEPAFQLFEEMRHRGLKPDAFTLSSLLKASSYGNVLAAEIVHGFATKMGFLSAVYVTAGLVDNYSKAGELGSAEICFLESPLLDSGVWTAMVSGYVKNGMPESAIGVFIEMYNLGLSMNKFCLTSVLAALADGGCDVKQGKQVHSLCLKMGFLHCCPLPLSNALLSMYCNCGTKSDALRVFNEIKEPDVVSWSTLLRVFDGKEATELFKYLCLEGMDINEYTVINVLSAIEGPKLLNCGKQIHGWCFRNGLKSFISIGNAFVTMYGKCWQIDDAKRVFDEMDQRDLVSWNALISRYATHCLSDAAFWLFSNMRHSSLEPSTSTLASLFEAVSCSANMKQVTQIHSYIIKSGHSLDECVTAGLISSYGRCDGIKESEQVFDETIGWELMHVIAMVATFSDAGYHADALKLFERSRYMGIEMDSVSLSLILKICCALTSIELAQNIHSLALRSGIDKDNFVGSAMIDVYCKCGSLGDASKVFEKLTEKNLAVWNAMITGYAQHGCYNKAIELYENMSEEGINPDDITFLGILCACCHAGRVKEAYFYLNAMPKDHGLIPSLEHYACVVDLLGRVGDLQEAKYIIDHMPLSPDARVWQIFLTACNIHGNVELGKVAARELLLLEPDNDSAFVLLSNIYAAAGVWEEVRKMRKGMRESRVTKEPGCSWVQVRGTVHCFFAGGTSHSQALDIYLMLEVLYKQMMIIEEMAVQ